MFSEEGRGIMDAAIGYVVVCLAAVRGILSLAGYGRYRRGGMDKGLYIDSGRVRQW